MATLRYIVGGMTNKQNILFLIFLVLSLLYAKENELLVVGNIHQNHKNNHNYSYQDVLNTLYTYEPDVICVENPEFYFRKQIYLKEMVIASIYCLDNGKRVYPIDWFQPSKNVRAEREDFMKTDSYTLNEVEEKKNSAYRSLSINTTLMIFFQNKKVFI